MWDGHNRVSIEPEIAESHTRLAEIALDSLQQHWTPRAPWLKALAGFPARARAALDAIDALPYDDALYPAIEAALQRIGAEADALLATVTRKHPERVPDAICFLMGTLIELNTYSYLDGSVPEHLGERLGALHHALAMRAEGCLMPWLEEAFAPVRQTPPDELQRWCYGLPAGVR
jgi:hypothetical protein